LGVDCWHKLRTITVSNDRSIRRWKVEESSHLVYRGHKGPIDAIQILGDNTFVSGSQDGKLCLWKDSRKTCIATQLNSHGEEKGSPNWVSSLAAIKASDTFASGSNDGYVRIWSARNDRIQQTAAIPVSGFVNGLALTSRLLVAGCGREHRLGRWWNMKKCKDRLTIVRFPQDLSELVDQVDDEDESSESEDVDVDSDTEEANDSD
jgi:ribosomal RNA-processing protein 9